MQLFHLLQVFKRSVRMVHDVSHVGNLVFTAKSLANVNDARSGFAVPSLFSLTLHQLIMLCSVYSDRKALRLPKMVPVFRAAISARSARYGRPASAVAETHTHIVGSLLHSHSIYLCLSLSLSLSLSLLFALSSRVPSPCPLLAFSQFLVCFFQGGRVR